jgi:ATP-dependent RNA helicase DeaD
LDGLDVVIIVGRPNGPDEYTHIAGRTGRAGRSGKVINIVGPDSAAGIKSWEKMLGVDFTQLEMSDVKKMD